MPRTIWEAVWPPVFTPPPKVALSENTGVRDLLPKTKVYLQHCCADHWSQQLRETRGSLDIQPGQPALERLEFSGVWGKRTGPLLTYSQNQQRRFQTFQVKPEGREGRRTSREGHHPHTPFPYQQTPITLPGQRFSPCGLRSPRGLLSGTLHVRYLRYDS